MHALKRPCMQHMCAVTPRNATHARTRTLGSTRKARVGMRVVLRLCSTQEGAVFCRSELQGSLISPATARTSRSTGQLYGSSLISFPSPSKGLSKIYELLDNPPAKTNKLKNIFFLMMKGNIGIVAFSSFWGVLIISK